MYVANTILELGKSLGPPKGSGTGSKKESNVFTSIASFNVLPGKTELRKSISENPLVSRIGTKTKSTQ